MVHFSHCSYTSVCLDLAVRGAAVLKRLVIYVYLIFEDGVAAQKGEGEKIFLYVKA